MKQYLSSFYAILTFCALAGATYAVFAFDFQERPLPSPATSVVQEQTVATYGLMTNSDGLTNRIIFIPNAANVEEVTINNVLINRMSDAAVTAFSPSIQLDLRAYRANGNLFVPGRNKIEITLSASRSELLEPQIFLLTPDQAPQIKQQLIATNEVLARYTLYIAVLIGVMCIAGGLLNQTGASYFSFGLFAAALFMIAAIGLNPSFYEVVSQSRVSRIGLASLPFLVSLLIAFQVARKQIRFDGVEWGSFIFLTAAAVLTVISVLFGSVLVDAKVMHAVSIGGSLPFLLYACSRHLAGDAVRFRRKFTQLETRIGEQANLLDDQSRRIALEMQKTAVLQERQRMMRDIHDGIGGQLLSLMLRVRSGKLDKESTAESIKGSLTDLRLVVDSADHLGGDFVAALATFRTRAEQQLRAAAIILDWRQDDRLAGQFSTTGQTLELYRLLQEVVSNTIKHADATKLVVSIMLNENADTVRVRLSDDGKGFDAATQPQSGHGLKNLAARAKRLNGSLDISSQVGTGTCVDLSIPSATFKS